MDKHLGRNQDGDSHTAGHVDQIFMKERLATPRMRATRMRLLIKNLWADIQDCLKEYTT